MDILLLCKSVFGRSHALYSQLFLCLKGGFIGRMFDAYGPRVIMALGTAIYFLSFVLTSMASGYYEYLLAQGLLSGLGVGML